MHFIMLYCFYIDCSMKILKNKHSCNVLLDLNNKIHVTFIVPKLIMIAQSHIRSFPYIIQCKIVTPGAGSILTPGA